MAHPSTAEIISEYFDSGEQTDLRRQFLGLVFVALLVFSFGWNLVSARSWIPAETIVVAPERFDDPAFQALQHRFVAADRDFGPYSGTAQLLVGRVLQEGNDSLVVLLPGSAPRVVRVPTAWVKARALCDEARSWLFRPAPIRTIQRYETCPSSK